MGNPSLDFLNAKLNEQRGYFHPPGVEYNPHYQAGIRAEKVEAEMQDGISSNNSTNCSGAGAGGGHKPGVITAILTPREWAFWIVFGLAAYGAVRVAEYINTPLFYRSSGHNGAVIKKTEADKPVDKTETDFTKWNVQQQNMRLSMITSCAQRVNYPFTQNDLSEVGDVPDECYRNITLSSVSSQLGNAGRQTPPLAGSKVYVPMRERVYEKDFKTLYPEGDSMLSRRDLSMGFIKCWEQLVVVKSNDTWTQIVLPTRLRAEQKTGYVVTSAVRPYPAGGCISPDFPHNPL